MSYAYFSRRELENFLQEIRTAYEGLGDAVAQSMANGSTWDDSTARELMDNVRREAERIRNEQTDHLMRSPGGALDMELMDAVIAYDETVSILEGRAR